MWGKKFIKLLLVFLVFFIGWIFFSFKTHGLLLKLQLLLLIVFMLASFIILLGIFVEERWSWSLSFILFALAILNVLFIKYYVAGNNWLFGITLLAALAGFMISISNMGKDREVIEEPIEEMPKVETYNTSKEKLVTKTRKKKKR